MKKFGILFVKLSLFWLIFFALGRCYFFVYNARDLEHIPFLTILSTFYHALYIDFATLSYILAITWLLWSFQNFLPKTRHILFFVQCFFVFIAAFVFAAEPLLYAEWKTKINYTAIYYFFTTPILAFHSVSYVPLLMTFLIAFSFIFSSYFILKKIFAPSFTLPKPVKFILPLLFPFFILGIRGGLQPISIAQNDVYFSDKYPILNLAAVNAVWNIGQTLENFSQIDTKKYLSGLTEEKINTLLKPLFIASETPRKEPLFTLEKPNIVLFLLEGWSADMLNSLTGNLYVAPFLDSLAQEGFSFTQAIASGTHSDQGVGSIFAGFPALPNASAVILQQNKYIHLPFLLTPFQELGYTTSFYFGGNLSQGNIGSYLSDHRVLVREEKHFPKVPKKDRGRLGIHDHAMLPIFLESLNLQQEPFFSTFFTMSSHFPYDYPDHTMPIQSEQERGYLNGVRFTDDHLRLFFQEAKKQTWYKNTFFIFVSDHSHPTPNQYNYYSAENHHIPFFFFGEALNPIYRNKKEENLVNHHDLPKTLLSELGLKKQAEQFIWSSDLWHNSPNFAYYSFTDGAGLLGQKGQIAFDYPSKQFHQNDAYTGGEKQKEQLFAYLQKLLEYYIALDKF